MDLSVAEAAERLGVDRSRVEQLLWSGRLAGRQAGRIWFVDAQSVADLHAHRAPAGRPMAPARAWGLLDLLSGGPAAWLPPVARSQVRGRIPGLADADAGVWRALLRARSDVLRVRIHPSAWDSMLEDLGPDGIVAGPARAMALGADLVDLDPGREVYVRSGRWLKAAKRWHAKVSGADANVLVRLPRDLWPFEAGEGALPAAIAADLLSASEPRSVDAGLRMLRDLVKQYNADRGVAVGHGK
jgi:excisionase family DNA binding protein